VWEMSAVMLSRLKHRNMYAGSSTSSTAAMVNRVRRTSTTGCQYQARDSYMEYRGPQRSLNGEGWESDNDDGDDGSEVDGDVNDGSGVDADGDVDVGVVAVSACMGVDFILLSSPSTTPTTAAAAVV